MSIACQRALVLLLLAVPLRAGVAQAPLSVREALRRADQHGFAERSADASVRAASARVTASLQGLLPSVRIDAGVLRTDDPLAAFGVLLQQRGVTPAAFDPSGLNLPPARSDVSTGVVVQVPLLNADAWAGREAAGLARTAATANADWVASGSHLAVVRAYYAATLARARVGVLESADTAAGAHVRAAESAMAAGMVTRSDVLLASVRQGAIETQLLAARSDAGIARLRLALALGTPGDTTWTMPGSLPARLDMPVDSGSIGARGDLRAALASRAAAAAIQRQSDLALLPRVNGFGRYDWHSATSLASGRPMWTVGISASWAPFSGVAEIAARRQAAAQADEAAVGADAAQAEAELEVQSALASVAVARQSLIIAARGVQQAAEAHRIVARMYAGGLATVSELLDAQAAELTARLGEASARFDLVMAGAALAHARGSDLTAFADALDAAPIQPE